jgi:hypothetical protein
MITKDRIAMLDMLVYIDVSHAAQMCDCSVRTIRRRMADNNHRVIEIGKKHFFLAREFKKILEDNPIGSHTVCAR